MKIAVTSQNFRTVTGHAGRARRFLIYQVGPDGEPVEVDRLDLPKELAMHDFRGGDAHPIDGVDVVVSAGFGEGFGQRMARRGVVAVVTAKTDPIDAVKDYLAQMGTVGPKATLGTCGCHGGHGEHKAHGHAHDHAHGHDHDHAHGHGHHHRHAADAANDAGRPRGRARVQDVGEPEGGAPA